MRIGDSPIWVLSIIWWNRRKKNIISEEWLLIRKNSADSVKRILIIRLYKLYLNNLIFFEVNLIFLLLDKIFWIVKLFS